MNLNRLRNANMIRNLEWNKGKKPVDLSFRGIELGGEVGELLNSLKKHMRSEYGVEGLEEADIQNIKDELADVIISADLIAMDLGIDLSDAIKEKFNYTSTKHGFETRL